jgi:hypothetical protein
MGLGEMMARLWPRPDRDRILISSAEHERLWQNYRQVSDERNCFRGLLDESRRSERLWKAAALLLATTAGYSHPRLCIRYAGILADAGDGVIVRAEFDHHWAKCSDAERATVRLVCGGLGVAVPGVEAAAVPGNLGYWEAVQ